LPTVNPSRSIGKVGAIREWLRSDIKIIKGHQPPSSIPGMSWVKPDVFGQIGYISHHPKILLTPKL
jgi:hypothetical protein